MSAFNPLEASVLEAIAAQHPGERATLSGQFRAARVIDRTNTGAGFFIAFAVDPNIARPTRLRQPIGGIWADTEGFRDPMTFLVFIADGYATTLEGAAIRDNTTGVDFRRVGFGLKA